ncbi:MAG TPA: helix-hairpin-helix domain-containing protein [Candidatus Sulfomarinibacteraceae bacterium]|nr:helix-hairpin-helix domain-containing protein [Candidatus Sulfomarinibacteraceae bacterium]
MSRKSFWFGFLLAVAFAIWWILRQKSKQDSPFQAILESEPQVRQPRHEEPEPDPLQEIAGIGPVFARRLHNAGITTFRQLAMLPPERLRDIVHVAPWQADVTSWIEQARKRAA